MLFVGEVSFKLQGSKEGAFNFQPLLSIALTFLTDGEGILSPLKRRRKRRRSSAAVFIMRRFSIGTHQSSAVLIVLLSLFFNQSNSLAISGVSKRFLLTASSKPSYSDSAPQYISSLQRIFGFRMRRSTSQQSTPIGGGAYQEVTRRELLNGVSDNPVELKRPEKLKNKYYGLRHGKT